MSKSISATKMTSGLVGAVMVLLILVAANVIVDNLNIRKDLTEEKIYSLSKGTKSLVGKLDRPVTLKLFFSKSNPKVPAPLKTFASRIEDLLDEYKLIGKKNIIIEIHDPEPDSDNEEWAQSYGITPQTIDMFGPPFYLGLVAISGDNEGAIPAIGPANEQLLEFYITRLIYRITHPEKPVVGVMSSLPVLGGQNQFHMPNQPPPPPAWAAFQELGNDYEVRNISITADSIAPNVNTLVLVHPKDLSDATLFALDQFVLRGGHLIAFLDPFCTVDQPAMPTQQFMRQGNSSNLEKLLMAWGIGYDPGKVLADMRAATRVQAGNQIEESPVWPSFRAENMRKDDILTSQLELIQTPLPGSFTDNTSAELSVTPLITSSANSALVNSQMAQFGTSAIRNELKPIGSPQNVAVRLTGKFKTAFPDGKPADKDTDEKKEDDKKQENTADASLKEGEGSVILVGDVDMLNDSYCVRQINILGSFALQPRNDNLNFFANTVEQMAGSDDLIAIRSRGKFDRPFTVVQGLEEKARKDWHAKEEELQNKLSETQRKISQLQSEKDTNQRLIMNAQQQQEIANFRKEVTRIQKQLRDVRKNLRKDIENLGVVVKTINIGLMPMVVCIAGLSYWFVRKKKK